MAEFMVSIVHELTQPIDDAEALFEVLGDEPAVSVGDTELGLTTHVVADQPAAALSVVEHLVSTTAGQAGVHLGPIVEVEIIEASRFARTLEGGDAPQPTT